MNVLKRLNSSYRNDIIRFTFLKGTNSKLNGGNGERRGNSSKYYNREMTVACTIVMRLEINRIIGRRILMTVM